MSPGPQTPSTAPELVEARLGPVTIQAPHRVPRQLEGAHGHLWQWVGDGSCLLSLSVAVRTTTLGTTADGVAHHLGWEIGRVRDGLSDDVIPQVERRPVDVPGASHAAAAMVDGVRDGIEICNGLLVSSDGELMHVVQVAATATDAGRALVEEVVGEVSVHPWQLPR